MALSEHDIEQHLPATAAQIKAILDADPRTVRDIPVPALVNFLHHEHPLAFTNSEENRHYGPLVEIRKNPGAAGQLLVAGIDRLIHHVHQPTAQVVECGSDPDVATLLHLIVARLEELAEDPAVAVFGVDVQAVKDGLQGLHGGRKYEGVTEAQIQSVMDAREARLTREQLILDYEAATGQFVDLHKMDRTTIVAGLRAAADYVESPPVPDPA